jgi:hypothetical protein
MAMAGVLAAALTVDATAPDVAPLIERAAAHVARFVADSAVLLAREHYEQEAVTRTGAATLFPHARAGATTERRTLESDVAVVQLQDDRIWLLARDILAVDGRPLEERQRIRIPTLHPATSADALDAFRTVAQQGARFNIGGVRRDLNVPTVALWFLSDRMRPHFTFSEAGAEPVDGRPCVRVRYVERARPYLLHAEGRPARVEGRFWIEEDSGAVLRTELVLPSPPGATPGRALITVDYAYAAGVAAWVPREMREHYEVGEGGANVVTGVARYSEYRRFSVETRIVPQ